MSVLFFQLIILFTVAAAGKAAFVVAMIWTGWTFLMVRSGELKALQLGMVFMGLVLAYGN